MQGRMLLILFVVLLVITACESESSREKGATFYWFEYKGQDTFYQNHALDGNEYFIERDEFDGDSLASYWTFIRTPKEKWYSLGEGALRISCEPVSFREKKNPAFIGRRQQYLRFRAITAVSLIADLSGDCAGLLCFRTESNNYFLGISSGQNGLEAFVEKTIRRDGQLVRKRLAMKKTGLIETKRVYLRIDGTDDVLDFFISEDNQTWETLAEGQDATYLNAAGSIAGTYIGMYAGSLGFYSNRQITVSL
jgi:alpha-N-arabinofuranosidase